MTDNPLLDTINKRLNYYHAQILELRVKNVALAKLACSYLEQIQNTEKTPLEYAKFHSINREEWR